VTVITGDAAADGKKVSITAVPYYAWANRDRGPMAVWLDEAAPAKAGKK